jgi:hypothetical protein
MKNASVTSSITWTKNIAAAVVVLTAVSLFSIAASLEAGRARTANAGADLKCHYSMRSGSICNAAGQEADPLASARLFKLSLLLRS